MSRNDKIWNYKICSVTRVLNLASHYMFQWQAARKKSIFVEDDSNQGCH